MKTFNNAVALTGGIGSGKSTVLRLFKLKGAVALDADRIVHELLARDGKALSKIRREFGAAVFNESGELNKKALARIVFASDRKRRALEKILHPMVRRKIAEAVKRNRRRTVVCDIPLLFETGWDKSFNRIIVVAARKARRVERLKEKGFSSADIRARMKAQWPLELKKRKADFVVDNNGNKHQTRKQVEEIWKRINNP